MDKLKVGIIVDGMLVPAWVLTSIRKILATGIAEICVVINAGKMDESPLPYLFARYRKRDEEKGLKKPDALHKSPVFDVVNGVFTVESGDVEAILKAKPDVLVSFSCKTVSEKGEIVSKRGQIVSNSESIVSESGRTVRYGTWRHFFGEERNTEVPGAWEVLERRSVITSGVETEISGRPGKILYQSYSLTKPSSMKESMNEVYWKSASFAARLLQQLHANLGKFEANNNAIETGQHSGGKYLKAPSDAAFIGVIAATTAKRILNKLKRLGTRRDWILMYDTNSYAGKRFAAKDFTRLAAPAGFFWADPIVVEREGKHYLFAEEYLYAEGKGRICVMEMGDDGKFGAAVTVLEQPYHLSYPFVFEHCGAYYMIPETSDNKTIELYECLEFPYKWAFKRNLMEGVRAADSTLLYREGKWWLFTTIEENEGASLLDELFLFHTDDIINGELKPHPMNPIVSDVRRARPAGPLFEAGGALYRPSQICAPYYGWGVSVNTVITLTEQEYEEEAVEHIAPDAGAGMAGIHTIGYAGKLCVVDALVDVK